MKFVSTQIVDHINGSTSSCTYKDGKDLWDFWTSFAEGDDKRLFDLVEKFANDFEAQEGNLTLQEFYQEFLKNKEKKQIERIVNILNNTWEYGQKLKEIHDSNK